MDAEAYEKVVMAEKDRIFGFASMMLRDPAEAQDVSQEALVRLWKHRDRVEEAAARGWLSRTAHNLCIDRMRRRRSRGEVFSDVLDSVHEDGGPGPERLTEAGEAGREIARALAALSPEDRTVLLLREVQGLAYDEIARTVEVPLGTLKARLHRARERLRARLLRAGVAP